MLVRLLCIYLLSTSAIAADPSGMDLKQAQLSYEKALTLEGESQSHELQRAKQLYKKALLGSENHAYLHYNLGTVYLKLKEYGWSIYHLEQAYALNNDDERIVGNLERARLLAGVQGQNQEEQNVSQIFSATWSELSPKVLQIFAIILSLTLSLFTMTKGTCKRAAILWIGLIICSSLLYLAQVRSQGQWMDKKAVLLKADNPRSGIGLSYPGLLKNGQLKEGSTGKLIRSEQGWVQVQWSQNIRGWVEANKVGLIQ
jgi:tetratricopeptide (TPR) repeat protein